LLLPLPQSGLWRRHGTSISLNLRARKLARTQI
jgi:hypothetical protein